MPMSIAEMYPARTDSNGQTWYRPTQVPGLMWGWTMNPAYADASYNVSEETIREFDRKNTHRDPQWRYSNPEDNSEQN